MRVVYFDRNVFATICELREGVTEADVLKLKRAVYEQRITILFWCHSAPRNSERAACAKGKL